MLSRYYDTTLSPVFDVFDTFKLLNDFEPVTNRHATIDDEGIKIELPGVKPSDVDVSVKGRTLNIAGKSRHGKEFSYHYSLRSTIDVDAITARLQDGLLDIKLPKKQSETSIKKIEVLT